MSIKLKDLQKNVHIVGVTWDDEDSSITYKPGNITGKRIKKIIADTDDGDIEAMFKFLEDTVVDWDLVDASGEPFVMTRDIMEDLPLPYIKHVFSSIMEGSSQVGERQGS